MEEFIDYDIYIFDYEGTLSESPNKKLTLNDLIYEFDFRHLHPNKKIFDFVNSLSQKIIYVVGIIETNREVEQKNKWMQFNYPMIRKENCIFISNEYTKSEVISKIIERYNYNKNDIIFIDDKPSHIQDVSKLGIRSVLVDKITK